MINIIIIIIIIVIIIIIISMLHLAYRLSGIKSGL